MNSHLPSDMGHPRPPHRPRAVEGPLHLGAAPRRSESFATSVAALLRPARPRSIRMVPDGVSRRTDPNSRFSKPLITARLLALDLGIELPSHKVTSPK